MKRMIQLFVVLFVMSTALFGLAWEQMFPELNSYEVTEIKQGSVTNVGNYGYVFGLNDSLLAYYNNSSQLEIFTHWSPSLAIVSFCFANTVSDEIYCAVDDRGTESRSDGLYIFSTTYENDMNSSCYEVFPRLIKKLSTGFYFCCEYNSHFSEDGSTWEEIDEFLGKKINDIERTSSGKIFYGGEGTLYMQTPDSIVSYSTGFPDVNDIYVRGTPNNNEVIVTLGTGTYSDGLYKVLYNDSTIAGLERIDWIFEANLITEYIDSYIVTCKNSSDIYIVPFDTGVARLHDHGLDINNIYCIEDQYPIYTPNFMIGTDKGVFMCTGTTSIDNEQLTVDNYELQQNYPNPFNNETVIPYELKADSDVKISIYNAKGEMVREMSLGKMTKGVHEYKLSTESFSAGQYFYSLNINGEVTGTKKMLYLR